MIKEYYLKLRNTYHPDKLNLVFLLESPPASGIYFYDETGATTEPLFRGIMKLLNYKPTDKKDGLKFFKSKGYLLLDATYKQVNRLKGKERNETILSDFNNLVCVLESICLDKEIPIILVKANICKLLEERLTIKGFNIINNGTVIPFPSTGNQNRFHTEISKLFNRNNKTVQKMEEKWLRTDETLEAVSSLEMVAISLKDVKKDLYQWKWAILALHNSLQGFMVLALRGGSGLNCLRDDIAKEWLRAYRTDKPLPQEKLDSFLNLYSKIKNPDRMQWYVESKPFKPSGTQGESIKKLNSLRNEFVHFVPKGGSLEITGLPRIFLDCLNIIEFLCWECGNIFWHDKIVFKRAKKALSKSKKTLEMLSFSTKQ